VNVAAGDLSVVNHGTISADSFGSGNDGTVNVTVGTLQLANFGAITADAFGSGTVSSGTLSIGPDGQITTDTAGTGGGGNIVINVAGALAIDGVSATGPTTGISALTIGGTGNAGNIKVTAGSLSIGPNGEITTDTFGTGKGGNISVTVAGALSIDGTSSTLPTGVTALTGDGSTGNAGNITVTALAKAEQSKDQALVAASSGALGNLAFVSRRTAVAAPLLKRARPRQPTAPPGDSRCEQQRPRQPLGFDKSSGRRRDRLRRGDNQRRSGA
jgi:hypothetical protein